MNASATGASPFAVIAISVTLALAGCDRKLSDPPKPATEAAPAASGSSALCAAGDCQTAT